MREDELPLYDETEQGVAGDFNVVPPSTAKRQASAARFTGSRAELLAQLSGDAPPSEPRSRAQAAPGRTEAVGPLQAVIYLRVSTEEQARVGGGAEGYSIPYQRRACLQKAQELGATVVAEYSDLGESAKSALRPGLQRMLRELPALGVQLVIVHKIDRLARNTRDDYEINGAIAAAGARLASVSEHIDDTPAGRLNYVIQAGVAQYHSDNLRQEVMKGLTTKVEGGGTPYRAPTGYLNKRRYDGMADIRWVEEDPERSSLLRWAFSEYATGNWTVSRLQRTLTDKGFRTRVTERMPGGPISISGLHSI